MDKSAVSPLLRLIAMVASIFIASVAHAADCSGSVVADEFKITGFKFVTGSRQERLYLHTDYPKGCTADACKPTTYLVGGDSVAIGNACGGWTAVKYRSIKGLDFYGWVESKRLGDDLKNESVRRLLVKPIVGNWSGSMHNNYSYEYAVRERTIQLNRDCPWTRFTLIPYVSSTHPVAGEILVAIKTEKSPDGDARCGDDISYFKIITATDGCWSGTLGGFPSQAAMIASKDSYDGLSIDKCGTEGASYTDDLVEKFTDKKRYDGDERAVILDSLGQRPGGEVYLLMGISDPSGSVRRVASAYLRGAPEEVIPALIRVATHDEYSVVRATAAQHLANQFTMGGGYTCPAPERSEEQEENNSAIKAVEDNIDSLLSRLNDPTVSESIQTLFSPKKLNGPQSIACCMPEQTRAKVSAALEKAGMRDTAMANPAHCARP